jgi:hypothetical protein
MALCPFADYFNHAEEGCSFDSNVTGCWITADRSYGAGEELFVSYGKHSNDFLLAEYGFVLSQNKWDRIKLDNYVLRNMNDAQLETLDNRSLLGNYTLDSSDVCYRTQAALRGHTLTNAKWRRFLDGEDDGEADQGAVNKRLVELLTFFQSDVEETLQAVDRLPKCAQKETLTHRWKQIQAMIQRSMRRYT